MVKKNALGSKLMRDMFAKRKNITILDDIIDIRSALKPSQENPDGGIIEKEAPIHVSNVMAYDSKAKTASRVGYKVETNKKGETEKVRVYKKTGKVIKGGKK